MATERLYRATQKNVSPAKNRLFKASTMGKVESHLVTETYEIAVASAVEVAELMAAGVKVETPTE